MNIKSHLNLARLKRAKQNRYNPLPSLTDPTALTRKLDSFEAGYLKDAVNIWDTLEQRDDLIRTVVSKRKKSIGRQGWTVLIHDTVTPDRRAEAEAHAAALEYFYANLRAENALDRAERGGFKLLCRQMMDAIGKRFAVHEIVWKLGRTGASPVAEGAPPDASYDAAQRHENSSSSLPLLPPVNNPSAPSAPSAVETPPSLSPFPSVENPSASSEYSVVSNAFSPSSRSSREANPQLSTLHPQLLTATFRFVPLSFFENTTGDLRYLETESAVEGAPLAPGAWMITVGEGLMFATAQAWILKNMTLNDWLLYSERHGRPGLRGVTPSAPDSDEWKALESALDDILNGSAVVHSNADDVKVIDLAAGNHIPFPELVDRIDRHIAALWRGADLSTISRDRGYGASLQEKETAALEQDDAEILTETLNEYVDQWVIRYLFGDDVQPLANVKVLVTPEENTTAELQIDDFLFRTGAPLALAETMNRYGRSLPKPGEATLQAKPGEAILQLPLTHNHTLTRNPRSSVTSAVKTVPSSPSYLASSHTSTLPVPNSEDAHDLEVSSAVIPRDSSSPFPVAAPCESAALSTAYTGGANVPVSQALSSPLQPPGSELSPPLSLLPPVPNSAPPSHFDIRTSHLLSSPSAPSLTFAVQNEMSDHSPESVSTLSDNFAPRTSPFELLQNDWLQLSPYGDFPHTRGLQRVDRAAADTMVKRFNSFRARLGRLFSGAPFYIGHPDLPGTSELVDHKAYGWIMELAAREDGIYGRVKWSKAGLELLKNAHFKFLSPYWSCEQIPGSNNGPVFRPTNLISVGLTNQPNLPVKPLANTDLVPPTHTHNLTPNLLAPPVAAPCESAALSTPKTGGANVPMSLSSSSSDLNSRSENQFKGNQLEAGLGTQPLSNPVSLISAPRDSASAQPNREAEGGLGCGPLPPVQNSVSPSHLDPRPSHFKNSSSVISVPSVVNESSPPPSIDRFAAKNELSDDSCKLVSASPCSHFAPRPSNLALTRLHTHSITGSIARRRAERLPNFSRRERIHNAVQHQLRQGLTYDQAWENVKKQHTDWFFPHS